MEYVKRNGQMALHFLVFYQIYFTLLTGMPNVSKVFLRDAKLPVLDFFHKH